MKKPTVYDADWLAEQVRKLKGSGAIKRDSDIAETVKINRSNISNYLSGRVKMSEGFIKKFLDAYPQLINNSLQTNTLSEPSAASKKSSLSANAILLEENDYQIMMIPLVNKYAYAGYQAGFGDDEYIESLPRVPMMVNKEHKGKYFAFEVKGDSMDNGLAGSYQEGMILHARELPKPHWKDKLHIHKWKNWVIITKNDGILFKQIIKHDRETGIVMLHSLNEEYKDFEMNLENVAQLLNVVGGNFK